METASNGALIHWESAGEGSALILLHGNGENMTVFERQIEFFSAHMRVITIDSRGHGKSTSGEKALSLYDMAEDIPYVMKDAGIQKASVLGFSDGGNVAMIFAIRHPELLDKLVLSGANSDPGGLRLRYLIPMRLAQIGATIASPFSEKACKKKEFLDLMIREPKLKKENLAAINAPTLITAGEDDMISRTHTEFIHRSIEDSELRYFPGGHFTPFERADEYNAAVADFLYIKKG